MSSDFGGSEADLVRMESVAAIRMSQSYVGHGPIRGQYPGHVTSIDQSEASMSQSYVGHDRGQTSVRRHKVQFREDGTAAEASGGHKVSFSPDRMTSMDHRQEEL